MPYRNFTIIISLLVFLSLPFAAASAKSAEQVGSVVFVLGQAVAQSADGKRRALKRQGAVYAKDVIITNKKSQVQVRFTDNGFVSIRPGSEFKVSGYSFNDSKAPNKKEFELVKGGFRAITGQIGRVNKKAFKLKTPVATLGIRGTDFTVMYCNQDCGSDFRKVSSNVANGLYVGVISGGVEMANKVGSMFLSANQYAFIKNLGSRPARLPKPPSFLLFDRTEKSKSARSAKSRTRKAGMNKQRVAGSKNSNSNGGTSTGDALSENVAQLGSDLDGLIDKDAMESELKDQAGAGFQLLSDLMEKRYDDSTGDLLPSLDDSTNPLEQTVDPVIDPNQEQVNSDPTIDPGTTEVPTVNVGQPFVIAMTDVSSRTGDSILDHTEASMTQYNDALNSIDGIKGATNNPDYYFSETEYQLDGVLLDVGYDSNTGLSWGRWSTGSISYELEASAGDATTINNQVHWVTIQSHDEFGNPILNRVIDGMPTTGTATYDIIAGNTSPTDNLGNSGLLGSASLTAHFDGTPTVDANLVVTNIDSKEWTASATGLPLETAHYTFGGALNVSIYDTLSLQTTSGTGQLSGFFSNMDTVVNQPKDAGIVYQINGSDRTITGSAALRRTDL